MWAYLVTSSKCISNKAQKFYPKKKRMKTYEFHRSGLRSCQGSCSEVQGVLFLLASLTGSGSKPQVRGPAFSWHHEAAVPDKKYEFKYRSTSGHSRSGRLASQLLVNCSQFGRRHLAKFQWARRKRRFGLEAWFWLVKFGSDRWFRWETWSKQMVGWWRMC